MILGDNVSIGMGTTISATKKLIIGDNVFTTRNVYVSDHGPAYEDITKSIGCQGITKVMEVRIGAGAWLGQNAVVLPGVTIGVHYVIGANTVVTKDIPDYSVAVGVPAQVIKQYNRTKGLWENVKKYG